MRFVGDDPGPNVLRAHRFIPSLSAPASRKVPPTTRPRARPSRVGIRIRNRLHLVTRRHLAPRSRSPSRLRSGRRSGPGRCPWRESPGRNPSKSRTDPRRSPVARTGRPTAPVTSEPVSSRTLLHMSAGSRLEPNDPLVMVVQPTENSPVVLAVLALHPVVIAAVLTDVRGQICIQVLEFRARGDEHAVRLKAADNASDENADRNDGSRDSAERQPPSVGRCKNHRVTSTIENAAGRETSSAKGWGSAPRRESWSAVRRRNRLRYRV